LLCICAANKSGTASIDHSVKPSKKDPLTKSITRDVVDETSLNRTNDDAIDQKELLQTKQSTSGMLFRWFDKIQL